MDEGAFDMDIQLVPNERAIRRRRARSNSSEFRQPRRWCREPAETAFDTGRLTGFVGVLKPRSAWTSAGSREELIGKMRDSLSDIPGMVFSFSQPIQCRIDELVAGSGPR